MKQWILRETRSPRIDWHILCHRGVSDPGEVERFMNPDYDKHLNDPYLLSDMERAVGRLTKAIEGDERVGIFADYDADGICSAAVLSDFFKKVDFKNFFIHIPDRNKDGFGLSDDALRVFTKEKVSLLFTLDCGITNAEEVQILNKCGVDIIIVDHHLPQTGALPDAYAIINPKRDGETYPFPYLSGAGLTFKLVDALMRKGVFNIPYGWEKWLLDLVAIAAVADMVPLIGENRVLVRYGLEVLKKTRRPGLLSLYGKFRLKKNHFSEDDIAFTIAPKINIAGRMGDARESLTLLTTDSWDEAERIVDHLNGLYVDRKEAVNFIMKSIESNFAREEEIPGIILCGDKSWHPGVLGLAANKAVEKYQSPVFLWGQGEGSDIKGSCRTDGSINVVEMMRAVPLGFFNEFGGHESAGGF
ncbi:MAG TPA: DHH family phosphoesterase, partial [Candidatus Paceibacterota bacterium]